MSDRGARVADAPADGRRRFLRLSAALAPLSLGGCLSLNEETGSTSGSAAVTTSTTGGTAAAPAGEGTLLSSPPAASAPPPASNPAPTSAGSRPPILSAPPAPIDPARFPDWSRRMSAWAVQDIANGSPVNVAQPGTDIGDFYNQYGGWSFALDYGAYGAIILFGGGHAGNISPQVFAFDVESRQFVRVADEPPRPWRWSAGSEAELGSDPTGASRVTDGWRYRFASPDPSKWVGDSRRGGVTYGELAPGVPMVPHVYGAVTCLPAGVLSGGSKGSLVVPVHSSQHQSSGIASYFGHQLDLASGQWRRMADELGPDTYYFGLSGGNDPGDYRWMKNQPNASTAEYADGAVYLRCRFDANNRAVARMDVTGNAGSERWSVIPGVGQLNNQGQGPGCLVGDSRWWVDYLPGTGELMVADIGHNESSRHTWMTARLVGDPMPTTRATPAMIYVRSARRIVLFAADGTWPGNTLVEIAVPNEIGGDWVVRRNSLGGVTPAPSTPETWRKLVACEKAGVLLWYPGWPGAVQAIKPSWWV